MGSAIAAGWRPPVRVAPVRPAPVRLIPVWLAALGLAAQPARAQPAIPAPVSSAPVAAAPTLCRSDEAVAFSCETARGIASLCRVQGRHHPALRYRFGQPGHPALVYPVPDRPAAHAFQAGDLAFSGGGGAYARFRNGRYRYTLFTATGRWFPAGDGTAAVAGVAVDRDGQNAASLVCRPDTVRSELGDALFRLLRMTPGDGDGFAIPDAFMPR